MYLLMCNHVRHTPPTTRNVYSNNKHCWLLFPPLPPPSLLHLPHSLLPPSLPPSLPSLQPLAQLELLCQELYESHDPDVRAQAEKALVGFTESSDSLPQCQLILEQSQSPYALLLAASTMTKLVTRTTTNLSIQDRLQLSKLLTFLINAHLIIGVLPNYDGTCYIHVHVAVVYIIYVYRVCVIIYQFYIVCLSFRKLCSPVSRQPAQPHSLCDSISSAGEAVPQIFLIH